MTSQEQIKLCYGIIALAATWVKQDNVQVNTESVRCISIDYSEVLTTEISEQLTRLDQSDYNE